MGRIRANLVVAIVILAGMCVWALLRPSAARPSHDRPDSSARRPWRIEPRRGRSRAFSQTASRRRLDSAKPSSAADTRGPFRIDGTVVTHEARDVVPEAELRAVAGFETGPPAIALATAAADGSFSIDLRGEGFIWATLNAATPTGAGSISIDLEPPFSGSRDLGEVELGAFKSLAFKVVTTSGDPIEGAMVQADSDLTRIGSSGPDGTGVLDLDRQAASLRAVAAGFGLVSVPVSQVRRWWRRALRRRPR